MDTNENPSPETPTNFDGGAVRQLLDQAARAYMDGDYAAAVGAWQGVLEADPSNPRAREGIKKVSMLEADDRAGEDLPFEPVLDEIEDLLKRRQFNEALENCHRSAESAGPALKTSLRRLQQRAERARAAEPEIQRCMVSARRSLQDGNVREALPHLKQVLTLDRSHPVATRLMEGLRQRVKQRSHASEAVVQDLPASGQPGSDAPAEALPVRETEPAPLGHGLPSSPVGEGDDPSTPEIELDMVALDTDGEEEGIETASDAPMAIELESEEPALGLGDITLGAAEPKVAPDNAFADAGRHSNGQGREAEAPFHADDAASDPGGETGSPDAESQSASAETSAAADPLADVAGESMADMFENEDESALEKEIIPRPSSRAGRSGKVLRYGALAAVLLAASGVAAWQMGLLPTPQEDFSMTAITEPAADSKSAAVAVDTEPAPGSAASEPVAVEPAAAAAESEKSTASDARRALMLLEQGQDLFNAGRQSEAAEKFRQAQTLDPVNRDIASWLSRTEQGASQASQQQAAHDAAVAAFESGDFETALRRFYRLQEADASGPYSRYIVHSWYNWGLEFLAAGNLREASKKMDEVLSIQPEDADALAIQNLVSDYVRRAKDRAFYTHIESLRYRTLDS